MKLRVGAVLAVGLAVVLVVNGGLDASGPAVGVIPPPCDSPAASAAVGEATGCFTGVVTVKEITTAVANGMRSRAAQASAVPDTWEVNLSSSNCPLADAMQEDNPLVDETLDVPNNGSAHSDVLAVYRSADNHGSDKCEYLLSETKVTGFTTTYSVDSPFTLPDNGGLTGNDQQVVVTNSFPATTSPPTPAPPVTTPPACAPFTDVSAANAFCDDIAWAKDHGITTGNTDGSFTPTATVRRQAMAGFLYRYEHPGVTATACITAPFTDVTVTNAFCADIAALKAEGIIVGNRDGTFAPAGSVSRQTMAAFLYRVADPGKTAPACTSTLFTDVTVTNVFCGDINFLVSNGVTTGYPDGGFHPTGLVTRQEMAAFVHRLYTATH